MASVEMVPHGDSASAPNGLSTRESWAQSPIRRGNAQVPWPAVACGVLLLMGCFAGVLLFGHSGKGGSSGHGDDSGNTRHGDKGAVVTVLNNCSDFPHAKKMDCGEGVHLCGVLTLETGEGTGYYQHPQPGVHGLWPQNGHYGNSKCERPNTSATPSSLNACYRPQTSGESAAHQLDFERHEWEKHGTCAGVNDATNFFEQVCSLARGPLEIMKAARNENLELQRVATRLNDAGFCVFQTMSHYQVELSVCAGSDGKWKLTDTSNFPALCRWDGPDRPGSSGGGGHHHNHSAATECVPGRRGPPCSGNGDCEDKQGCIRCANSGYCTDISLHTSSSLHQSRRPFSAVAV